MDKNSSTAASFERLSSAAMRPRKMRRRRFRGSARAMVALPLSFAGSEGTSMPR